MENRRGIVVLMLFFCFLIGAAGCTDREGRIGDPVDSGLRIITEENPPYNYLDTDGEVAGQSTEIVREILARMHEKAPIEVLPWSDAYGLALNTRDVALYSAARTPEREDLFSWVGPIGKQGFVFYSPRDSEITISGVDEIQGTYTVGVVRDDWRHQYLVKQGFMNLILYTDDIRAIQGVIDGEADLWFGSSDSVTPLSRAAGLEPTVLMPVYTLREIELFVAFNKDTDGDTIRRWQAALDGMKKDGKYEEITTREQFSLYIQPEGISGAGKESLALLISKSDTKLTGKADTLRLLAGTSDLVSGEMDRIQPVLANLKIDDKTTTFAFISPDGNWFISKDVMPRQDAGIRPYLVTLISGTPTIGVLITDPVTGREAAVVAVPVMSGDTVIGAIEAMIDLGSFSESLASDLSLAGTAYFAAFNEEGVIALHSHTEKIGVVSPGGTDTFSEALRTIISGEEGEVGFYEDGIYHQAAFRASKVSGWRYIIAEQGTPPIPPKTRAEEELESLIELHD